MIRQGSYLFSLDVPTAGDASPLVAYLSVSFVMHEEGQPLSLDTLHAFLAQAGIVYGISEMALRTIVSQGQAQRVQVAQGLAPEVGANAWFETLLPEKLTVYESLLSATERLPSLDVNALTVPYGTPLLRRHPPTAGAPGMSIYGHIIPGLLGQDRAFPPMRNTMVAPQDPHVLLAAIQGHPLLQLPDWIAVEPLYLLERDIQRSEDFDGIVIVKGSVRDQVRLYASSDIIVLGAVEAAVISSGRHVVITHGVKGKDMAVIKTRGNLLTRFAERCTIECGGTIQARSISQSYVVALSEIYADRIVAGETRSSSLIQSDRIGAARMDTHLIVGANIYLVDSLHRLEQQKGQLSEHINEVMREIADLLFQKQLEPQDPYLHHLRTRLGRLEFNLQKVSSESRQLALYQQESLHPQVFAFAEVQAGTLIQLANFEYSVEETVSNVVYQPGQYGIIQTHLS